jgi:hypothetical protein
MLIIIKSFTLHECDDDLNVFLLIYKTKISAVRGFLYVYICGMKKVMISLLQALEAPRVARGQGSHIT